MVEFGIVTFFLISIFLTGKRFFAITKLKFEEQSSAYNEPRSHRLCVQSFDARNMENSFDKIVADEKYNQDLNQYMEDMTNFSSENTVSMMKPLPKDKKKPPNDKAVK